jgi:hypothetical protein
LVSLWLGVVALYLGFAAVQGVLLRPPSRSPAWVSWAAALAYGLLLFIPSSFFVARFLSWPTSLRIVLLSLALLLVWLGRNPPASWATDLSEARLGRLYFAGSMALVALWASAAALTSPSAAPVLLGAIAVLAGWLVLQPRRWPRSLSQPPEVQ